MAINGKAKHVLLDQDLDTRDGVCQHCGPVKLVLHGVKGDGSPRLVCRNGRNSQPNRGTGQWARYNSRNAGHGLRYRDTVRLRDEAGSCWFCGSTKALRVDHDHETGIIRGVLCNRCNLLLGLLNDDTELLARMIQYLDHPPIGKTVEEIEQMSCAP